MHTLLQAAEGHTDTENVRDPYPLSFHAVASCFGWEPPGPPVPVEKVLPRMRLSENNNSAGCESAERTVYFCEIRCKRWYFLYKYPSFVYPHSVYLRFILYRRRVFVNKNQRFCEKNVEGSYKELVFGGFCFSSINPTKTVCF